MIHTMDFAHLILSTYVTLVVIKWAVDSCGENFPKSFVVLANYIHATLYYLFPISFPLSQS